MKGIENVRYEVGGYHFDAALDYGKVLHAYPFPEEDDDCLPVELFNLDKPDWDIRMLYAKRPLNWNEVIEETKKWISRCES